MTTPTQSDVDKMIAEFKDEILAQCGDNSIGMAIALNNNISKELGLYELFVRPEIEALGMVAPTVSEIFGIEISITESEPEND